MPGILHSEAVTLLAAFTKTILLLFSGHVRECGSDEWYPEEGGAILQGTFVHASHDNIFFSCNIYCTVTCN